MLRGGGGGYPFRVTVRQETQKRKKKKGRKEGSAMRCDERKEKDGDFFVFVFLGGIILITAGYNTHRRSVGRMDPRFC
jgi:hypothetical protein